MTQLGNVKILVVDDDCDTRNLLREILEQSGGSVTTAASVDEAIRAFRRSPAHVVVTDIRVGTSDGYSLIQAIRKLNAEYKGHTPVIAVTGYASPEDEDRARVAGFNAYLRKPLSGLEIVQAIRESLTMPPYLVA
jgi:CheY-like chemotaxis protein